MTSGGVKQSYIQGAKITDEIIHHVPNSGGVTVGIYGSKGSGKTTFLLTLAQTITCEDPVTHKHEKETIVWRGRSNDYWNWIPKEKVHIFIHKADFDKCIVKDDILRTIPREELPPMEPYVSIRHLNSRLRAGKINVVYEPTTYQLPERIKKLVQKRGGDDIKINQVDPVIFWFEFMDWMVHNKNPKFMSIIFDEADELFPQSPGGIRWHLNLWAKDVIKDLRRRRLSLFMACHGYQDLDGRLKPKIQYKIWMKGSVTMPESLIRRQAPLLLDPGVYYIERAGWGKASFSKIDERTIVLVYTDGRDERDDFGETSNDGSATGKGGPKGPGAPPAGIPPGMMPPPINGKTKFEISEDYIKRDVNGNIISIDFAKMKTDPEMEIIDPAISVKRKKASSSARKQPSYHRKSYIKERTTTNDDKVEIARKYDEGLESGSIDEVRVPKRERNDNTTDEVDK